MDKVTNKPVWDLLKLKLWHYANLCSKYDRDGSERIRGRLQRDGNVCRGQPSPRDRWNRNSHPDHLIGQETLLVSVLTLEQQQEKPSARLAYPIPRTFSITRYALLAILLFSAFVTLPQSTYAWYTTYFDNFDASTLGTMVTLTNTSTTTQVTDTHQLHISYYSTTTAQSVNTIRIREFTGPNTGYDPATGQSECSAFWLYVIDLATTTIATLGADFMTNGSINDSPVLTDYVLAESIVPTEHHIATGQQYELTYNDVQDYTEFIFSPPFTLAAYQDYTFVIVPICATDQENYWWYNVAAASPTADPGINGDVWLWREDTGAYSSYTGQPKDFQYQIMYDSVVSEIFAEEYIKINSVTWYYGTSTEYMLCENDSATEVTTSCKSTQLASAVLVNWVATYPFDATVNYDVTGLLTTPEGVTPFSLPSSLFQKYQPNITSGQEYQFTWPLYGASTTATSGNYNITLTLASDDFINGGSKAVSMLLCNYTDSAECDEIAGTMYHGGTLREQPTTCGITDIECILKKLFVPDRTFMTGLVQQASTTVMAVWPVGYLTREFYAYNEATSSSFEIPLNMSQFGLPTTTASINLSQAVTGINELSTEIDDLVTLLETIMWAMFWLFLAYRIYNGQRTVHQLSEA